MKKQKGKKQVSKIDKNSANSVKVRIPTRGRIFEGTVMRKFPKRVVIEFERTVYVPKFERFSKRKTRIHARLPEGFHDSIHIGDYIRVQECRPLSKMIHFIVIEKLKSKNNGEEKL